MYIKYLIAQTFVLFLIGSLFGAPGLYVAAVLSVLIGYIVFQIKKINDEVENKES